MTRVLLSGRGSTFSLEEEGQLLTLESGASAYCYIHLCACAHLLRVPSAFGNGGEQRRKPRSHPEEAQRLGEQLGKEPENSYQCTSQSGDFITLSF